MTLFPECDVSFRGRLRQALPFLPNGGLLLFLVLMALFRAVLLDVRLRPWPHAGGAWRCSPSSTTPPWWASCSGPSSWRRSADLEPSGRHSVSSSVSWSFFYGMDLLVIVLFNMRLVVEDFFKYGREVGGVITIARHMVETCRASPWSWC